MLHFYQIQQINLLIPQPSQINPPKIQYGNYLQDYQYPTIQFFINQLCIRQIYIKMEEIQKKLDNLTLSQKYKVLVAHNPQNLLHKSSRNHPQCPERIISIIRHLQQIQLPQNIIIKEFQIKNKQRTQKSIDQTHGNNHRQFVQQMWYEGITKAQLFINTDTYFMKDTYLAALAACDTIIQAIDEILIKNSSYSSLLALIRPPGHHCGMKSTPHGFSFFNNVGVGINHLIKCYGKKKIAIVDWDAHHGEGTQKLFYKSKDVLMISIHRFDKGTFFPHIKQSGSQNIGIGEAEGYNINICWNLPTKSKNQQYKNQQSCGDSEYAHCFKKIVMPVLKQFAPQFIFISCGFDSGNGDHIGNLKITDIGYSFMTQELMTFNKPIIAVLQGGYNLQTLKWGAQSVAKTLANQQSETVNRKIAKLRLQSQCNQIGRQGIQESIKNVKKYWQNLI